MQITEEEFAAIDQFLAQSALVDPVVSAQNLYSIYQCPDQQMYRARIQFLFGLNQWAYEETSRDALIDMVHGAILFASDNNFTYSKAIIFLTIYVQVFQFARSSPFYQPDELYRHYEKLLLSHSVDRPPFAAAIFELADVKIINDFFVNTFFRNIKLIINCFTTKPVLEFKGIFPVRVPMPDLPLLADMDSIGAAPPDDEPAPPPRDDAAAKAGKAPRPPRAPQQAAAERAPPKPAKEQPPAPPPEPEVPEERGPDVPVEALRESLAAMHERFVREFEEKERLLLGKIKELEIHLLEKPQLRKPPARKK
jgi:hypothetical protein